MLRVNAVPTIVGRRPYGRGASDLHGHPSARSGVCDAIVSTTVPVDTRTTMTGEDTPDTARDLLHRVVAGAERRIDAIRHEYDKDRTPEDLRIVPYIGHGTPAEVVMRARVVDDPEPPEAMPGESTWAAIKRSIARFETDEVRGVPVRVTLGDSSTETVSDEEGYVDIRLTDVGTVPLVDGWATGTMALAEPFRGLDPDDVPAVDAPVRMTHEDDDVGVISDVDDTILRTGAQRFLEMVRTTATGSALTRTPFAGVGELYRAFTQPMDGPRRPVFYVSSSPWNLHGFLTAFMAHRGIPLGPVLLRDLGIDDNKLIKSSHGTHKLRRIGEVLELHPELRVVLVGDSGQHDPQIYADVVEQHPGRVVAVWIREVRHDPGDGRVESVQPRFEEAGVPFLLAADSDEAADQAVDLGLITAADAVHVHEAVVEERTRADTTEGIGGSEAEGRRRDDRRP